jgi:hypothetical protein
LSIVLKLLFENKLLNENLPLGTVAAEKATTVLFFLSVPGTNRM